MDKCPVCNNNLEIKEPEQTLAGSTIIRAYCPICNKYFWRYYGDAVWIECF
jgi:uncharacterized protein with PIN domain